MSCSLRSECCEADQGETTCVNQGSGGVCAAYCTAHSQCNSGCCAALESGGAVCAPPTYCQ
jgi:hypothetical protein